MTTLRGLPLSYDMIFMRYHDMVYGVLGGMLWHFFCVISHICITKGLFFLCTNPYVLGPVHLLHNLNAHKYWEIFYCIQSMYWNTKCNPLSPYQHEAGRGHMTPSIP
jgi:hypothetical protein